MHIRDIFRQELSRISTSDEYQAWCASQKEEDPQTRNEDVLRSKLFRHQQDEPQYSDYYTHRPGRQRPMTIEEIQRFVAATVKRNQQGTTESLQLLLPTNEDTEEI